jgi:hypothetical protein
MPLISIFAVLSIQEPAPPRAKALDSLVACRSTRDGAERLACYDREVAALDTAASNADVVVLDRAQVRETRRTLFGFPVPDTKLFSARKGPQDDADRALDRLDTVVVKIGQLGDGRVAFTVEGGARWIQTDDRLFSPARTKPGAKVRIEKAAFGSFFATFERGSTIRVKREG